MQSISRGKYGPLNPGLHFLIVWSSVMRMESGGPILKDGPKAGAPGAQMAPSGRRNRPTNGSYFT
jgi:hypothetical protein